MTAAALITGALYKAPERRVSKSGNQFVMASVRVPIVGGAQFWKLFAFDEDAGAELRAGGTIPFDFFHAFRDGGQIG